jgi:hypothetical protein
MAFTAFLDLGVGLTNTVRTGMMHLNYSSSTAGFAPDLGFDYCKA